MKRLLLLGFIVSFGLILSRANQRSDETLPRSSKDHTLLRPPTPRGASPSPTDDHNHHKNQPYGDFDDDVVSQLPQEFHPYRSLKIKTLLTTAEKIQLHSVLTDINLVRRAEKILQARDEGQFLWKNQNKRLAAIEYLQSALQVTGSHQIAIRESLLSLLQSDTYRHEKNQLRPWELRLSLTGDQIELLQLLAQFFPKELPHIRRDYQDSPRMLKILRLIERRKNHDFFQS